MATPLFETQLWAIALKMEEDESAMRAKTDLMCTVHKFNVPDNLRVGTLDSLMSLSDDLVKLDMLSEGTVMKIYRQLYDLKGEDPTINGGALACGSCACPASHEPPAVSARRHQPLPPWRGRGVAPSLPPARRSPLGGRAASQPTLHESRAVPWPRPC